MKKKNIFIYLFRLTTSTSSRRIFHCLKINVSGKSDMKHLFTKR